MPALKLMIQGTASNAGKSLMVAALCRIFTNRGLKVAPFKAQNMSLNSCVCNEGHEMARAQMLQAMACRIQAKPEMNPILLKPDGANQSQVVVLGKSVGSMKITDYHQQYQHYFNLVLQALDRLKENYDLIIMEGAGSISEINLRQVDLVNMPLAVATQTPTLLVGNIDLGGVYASFLGSVQLLTEEERSLLKGFIVNRFYGDAELLTPAHTEIESRTSIPFLGVVPFLTKLRLPEEDSVAFSHPNWGKKGHGEYLDIVVLDLTFSSNINDFEPLLLEEDVQLRKVSHLHELGRPDVIILPGSKNVFSSLEVLKERGFFEALQNSHCYEILGICGGLNLLSKQISDPHRIEASGETSQNACALMDMEIELQKEKTLLEQNIHWSEFQQSSQGYEMHHGKVTVCSDQTIALSDQGVALAWRSKTNPKIWGTWCHGLFDDDHFRRTWLNSIRKKKALSPLDSKHHYHLDKEIDRLAQHVEAHCDIEEIWNMIQESH